MGLDMWLSKRIYIGARYEHRNVNGTIHITVGEDDRKVPIDFKKVTYIEEEVAYWRKANQIHSWFVKNVQNGIDDCKAYYVSIEQIRELVDLCKKVVEDSILVDGVIQNGHTYENGVRMPNYEEGKEIVDPSTARKLLPTQEGFFFGGTDYNEWYLDDIKSTIEMLEPVCTADNDGEVDYRYQSSW